MVWLGVAMMMAAVAIYVALIPWSGEVRIKSDSGQAFGIMALMLTLIAAPWLLPDYYVSQLVFIWIYAIAAIGLMILVGFTGQVSLGHAAFLAMGGQTRELESKAGAFG